MSLAEALAGLPQLVTIFRRCNNGEHLSRTGDASLWAELEAHVEDYRAVFAALGLTLEVDPRGFAWFAAERSDSNLGAQSRELALLFLVLLDTQADAGKPLGRFLTWTVDRALIQQAVATHQTMLRAETLDAGRLVELLGRATRLGFAREVPGGWQLLAPVYRYLDHFEALADAMQVEEGSAADVAEDGDA